MRPRSLFLSPFPQAYTHFIASPSSSSLSFLFQSVSTPFPLLFLSLCRPPLSLPVSVRKWGRTALMSASLWGHATAVEALHFAGADMEQKDSVSGVVKESVCLQA